MALLPLSIAHGRYDRVWPLLDGRVRPEGIDANHVILEPEECFWRMLRHEEFDVAEMSLSSYCIARALGDDRFVGIPVFLSRSFRHSMVYVRADAGIATPRDLEGRRVGVPEYQMTAAVWGRGLLAREHGVDLSTITWMTGGLEQPGRVERQPLSLPPWVHVRQLNTETTLVSALQAGHLDGVLAPRVPSLYRSGGCVRLFPDFADQDLTYFRHTGIFPIMHLVVVRRAVLELHPWVAESLFKAFTEAKDVALAGLADAPALRYTIPMLLPVLEDQQSVFGSDPWPYGMEANRVALDTFVELLVDQGLVDGALDPATLFAASTLTTSRI
ncbi:MAG: ABC transporter substrate-binding protein [Acidimicrobiales bacterium]